MGNKSSKYPPEESFYARLEEYALNVTSSKEIYTIIQKESDVNNSATHVSNNTLLLSKIDSEKLFDIGYRYGKCDSKSPREFNNGIILMNLAILLGHIPNWENYNWTVLFGQCVTWIKERSISEESCDGIIMLRYIIDNELCEEFNEDPILYWLKFID